MAKINEIQAAIIQLEGGAYQSLMDAYLYIKYGYSNISELGSHLGTNKTVKGSPDTFVRKDNGKYILITYGTVTNMSYSKIEEDIKKCLDPTKTHIAKDDIDEIIACHTSTRLTPIENKQLHSLFKNVRLIGIGEVAKDLCYYYPFIAKDHLNVSIDTEQILTLDGFYEKNLKSGFSTPLNMPLLQRDDEKVHLKESLNNHNMVLISGKAGVGKTRLALEMCKEYAKENDYNLKCVKQNGESIYDDLVSHFVDNKNYLIFIDDANQLSQLNHLLDLATDVRRNNTIKLVLTVRDYAIRKIEANIKAVMFPYEYELMALSSEAIEQVLRENLKINNQRTVKRILKIASGSLRLAIMAGTCVNNKLFDHVNNVYELYKSYYSEILRNMQKKHLIVGSLIAFADSVRINSDHVICQLAENKGINSGEFIEISRQLHELEVVDIFADLAIKFNEESFGNYILYYVLYEKRWITIEELIDTTLLSFPERLIYTISTLLNLFNDESMFEYVNQEVNIAWKETFISRSNQDKWIFVKMFKYFMLDVALVFTKQEIEKLENINVDFVNYDFVNYDFEKNKNQLKVDSDLIETLISYKSTDRFDDAIELAINYLNRNNTHPMDFYFLFTKYWSIDKNSHILGYEKETQLVNKLYEYYLQENNEKVAVMLISLISSLLKFQFDGSNYTGNYRIEILHFGLADSEELLGLRKKCVEILEVLSRNEIYYIKIMNLLHNYNLREQSETNMKIAIEDVANVKTFLTRSISNETFDECSINKHFFDLCERFNVKDLQESFNSFKKNKSFMLYTLLSSTNYLHQPWEEYRNKKETAVREWARTMTKTEFLDLIRLLKSRKLVYNDREFGNGICILLLTIPDESDCFTGCCEILMEYDMPISGNIRAVLQKLINLIGYDGSKALINKYEFQAIQIWRTILFSLLETKEMSKERSDEIIALLETQENHTAYILELEVILAANELNDNFAPRYLSKLIQKNMDSPFIFSGYFSAIETDSTDLIGRLYDSCNTEEMGNVFLGLYLAAIQDKNSYFDDDYKWFHFFYNRDPEILQQIIEIELSSFNLEWSALQGLWLLDEYEKAIEEVTTMVNDDKTSIFGKSQYLEVLFTQEDSKQKIHDWVVNYVNENAGDMERMKFIFKMICNLDYSLKLDAIQAFCGNNNSYAHFLEIDILRTHWSWSGSQIPYMEEEMTYIDNIQNNLRGLAFAEHRRWLAELTIDQRKQKEKILIAEFLEQR
ncbi:hypothetical protein HB820_01910 [Listeria booriae]|uniref:nSTAND3 domain-containing NTPase n=1 Tax=Listeria booriae TaxID=1552123 RepID=UPI001625C628|nr:hypothetical protein [Listeria booriae]MBC1334033.1 hypothetical protein [Listeria booriae]